MPKRTRATGVTYFSRDDTGAMASIDFDCPHCRYSTGEFIFVGVGGLTEIDSRFGFETDQTCGVCGEEVTIEVPASLY